MREKLHRVELANAKDPSELHLRDPDRFKQNLRAAFRAARRCWSDEARAEARDLEAWQTCKELATEGRILNRFASALERSGAAGEARFLKPLYLALTSRLLDKPVSIARKGSRPEPSGRTTTSSSRPSRAQPLAPPTSSAATSSSSSKGSGSMTYVTPALQYSSWQASTQCTSRNSLATSISITLDTCSHVIDGMDGGLADAMDYAL
jgi:hypothetical protein